MRRRTALAVIAGFLGAAAGGFAWDRYWRRPRRHKAKMRRDFDTGRIYVSDGWYLSAHEVNTLDIQQALPLAE